MARIRLNGFLPAGFTPSERLRGAVGGAQPLMVNDTVEIANARAFQAGAESEAAFFAEHGFVLLPHVTFDLARVPRWLRYPRWCGS